MKRFELSEDERANAARNGHFSLPSAHSNADTKPRRPLSPALRCRFLLGAGCLKSVSR
jgi:hypothetical protein